MVTILYLTTFIISLSMTIYYLARNPKTDNLLVCFGIVLTLNGGGRFMLAVSSSLEMALFAQKLIYIGNCYCPLLLVHIITRMCNVRVPRFLTSLLFIFASTVFCLAMTIGILPVYYKSVTLVQSGDYNYLAKVYGPTHFLNTVLMAVYSAVLLFYFVYSIKKSSTISTKIVSVMSLLGISVAGTYILQRIVHTNISYLSVGYLIASILMVNIAEHINMFDMSANIAASVDRLKEYGYIEFDNRFRYISANDYAKELFPEIVRTWHVDKAVPKSDSFLYTNLIDWAGDGTAKSKNIRFDDRYFDVNVRNIIYNRKRKVGYIIELVDRTSENNYLNAIKNYNWDLKREVAIKTADISHIKDMMVLGMATMVESRDNSTGGHIKRTSSVIDIYSKHLLPYCEQLHINAEFLQMLSKAAPMHDLGKIAIADSILQKQGRYNNDEYNQMKRHAAEGASIVESILRGVENDKFVELAKNVAHYHHEKWDGSGYPDGLAGDNIPLEARIMALADVFDALVSKRCYKEAYSYDMAFDIIESSLGTHFDPFLGKIFLECRGELKALYNEYAEK